MMVQANSPHSAKLQSILRQNASIVVYSPSHGPFIAFTRVYDEILERLFTGRWKPGHTFNRRQVAAELKVSVVPVLEAMLELQAEGLIEACAREGDGAGRSASNTSRDNRRREAIECQAARHYWRRRSASI